MAIVAKMYQMVMKFSGNQQGVSETLYLPDASRPAALATAARILVWRLACLSKGLTCDFARISEWGEDRDSNVVAPAFPITGKWPDAGVLTPPATALAPNIISDALTVRLETAEGRWTNRWLHGIPDSEVHLDQLVAVYSDIVVDAADDPADDLTFVEAVASYLSVVKQKTVFFKHTGSGDDEVLESWPLYAVLPVHIIAKKVGAPFRQQRGRATPR